MQRYIIRRFIEMVFVLFLVSVIVFTVLRLVPGDAASVLMGIEATDAGLAQLRHEMGLDQPIYVQYVFWVREVLKGNFGISWQSKRPALFLIQRRFPATVLLTLSATLIGLLLTIPLGILAGIRPFSAIDTFATTFALLGIAMPGFWLGLMLLLTFAVWLQWLPPSGYVPPQDNLGDALRHVLLPAFTLGIGLAAPLTRFLRSGMLDVMNQDYIRTARAKGLRTPTVILGHALKNALLSVVTVMGLLFGSMLGGAIITESVFNWPGIGTLLLLAIQQRDYGVVQGVVLFVTLIFMIVNLGVDILYAFLDPRIRFA
ncbi:MAG: ABC transporter permease [Chloroflexi bacterium]|nr:ABC transporter permease [Chloroflexota bacterium]